MVNFQSEFNLEKSCGWLTQLSVREHELEYITLDIWT